MMANCKRCAKLFNVGQSSDLCDGCFWKSAFKEQGRALEELRGIRRDRVVASEPEQPSSSATARRAEERFGRGRTRR